MKNIVLFGMGNLANDLAPEIVSLLGENQYFFYDNDETNGDHPYGIECITRHEFLSLQKIHGL